MAILGKSTSQIEVRLEKLPINGEHPTYFDEYAPIGDREALTDTITRYIVPEDQAYAIKIIFKEGYVSGKFDGGFGVIVHEKATGTDIFRQQLVGDSNSEDPSKDVIYPVASIPSAVVDGVVKQNVQLAFHQLSPDEELSGETDLLGCDATKVGGITVTIRRNSKRVIEPKPCDQWSEEMWNYNSQLATGSDSLWKAAKIDQKLFTKKGLTHGTILTGGETGGTLHLPSRNNAKSEHVEDRCYHFICRTAAFLEDSQIVKTPIPLISRPWRYFKEHERFNVFRDLQNYDKEQTLKQKIAEAGPHADAKAIQRDLLETGEIVNRWRGWSQTYKRERESLFKELQRRRNFFEKGEYPPDENQVGNSSKTAISLGELAPEDNSPANGGTPRASTTTIKAEPEDNRSLHFKSQAKPSVIVLDDSDEDPQGVSKKLNFKGTVIKSETTIKSEPEESRNQVQTASRKRSRVEDVRQSKKIKLEPGLSSSSTIKVDTELMRLKEEDELKEEELNAAQRVFELIQERNKRKGKIAALEAGSSATSTPRSHRRP
ncbi:uncharacterized protein LY89DRAFT_779943 [Mollisia scopiformis]|uniref:Uncharacterized protein n=1 Tax=Mollisia scopiformis TaxID=149040 RepID=A0A194XIY8_MOLSC|nr:uncharacterized protein LY89DRAFT_779943 [Mollisia scopiformis]KUJ20091.1 hypothetical protein LY89DRAFT_779943 [Mollisia scopiformis]